MFVLQLPSAAGENDLTRTSLVVLLNGSLIWFDLVLSIRLSIWRYACPGPQAGS
jgi:hypothetical protein